jgi:hypothetical protein
MQIAVYIAYAALLLTFLVLGGFAVFHAFKYSYISPRTRPITWVFVVVSAVLIAVSLYFLLILDF